MSSKPSAASKDARLQCLLAVHRYAPLPLFQSFESLTQLGHDNLSHLVRYVRRREAELSEELGALKDAELALVKGPALLDTAPEPKTAVLKFIRKPDVDAKGLPSIAALEQFKVGDTTLRMCGWCEHRGSGSYSYDAMVYGDCTLLSAVGGDYDQEARCTTVCQMSSWDAARFSGALVLLRERIVSVKKRREDMRDLSRSLRELRQGTSQLPALPAWRGDPHFTSGARVVVYTPPIGRGEPLVDGVPAWVVGRVEGPAHGTVRIKACTPVTVEGANGGRQVTSGVSLPYVLLLEEFWQLRAMALSRRAADKFFIECWLANAQDNARLFDADQFLEDLRRGAVAQLPDAKQAALSQEA